MKAHEKLLHEAIHDLPALKEPLFMQCQCPSNIAIVKYWGKHEGQIPKNPSISFTLKNRLPTLI
ncbi:MAG: hypothetical protein HC906_02565 [Bacteroidales bacterium]|nr:hypothetical protein [Bacteroidales bacterium]